MIAHVDPCGEVVLCVDGLPLSASSNDLAALIRPVDSPERIGIVSDHTGRSLRFGFIHLASEDDARKAETALAGTVLQGCHLRIARVPMAITKFAIHQSLQQAGVAG
jgi:RNA recognition motif. (a.k.a. RRM, RBD, or RNP domain)